MANAYITQVELPSGNTYDLHDSRVDNLNNWSYIVCSSAANTPKDVTWTSGSTTVTGTLVASSSTMYKIYLVPSTNGTNDIYDEYVTINTTGSTYVWEMFGNTKLPNMNDYVKNASGHSGGTAGALAYKSSASGSYTPAGGVSQPTFSGNALTSTGAYTPVGTIALTTGNKTATVSSASGTATYTPAGSVSQPTFSGTGVRLKTDKEVGTGASFTGASMTLTGSFTPSGSISVGSGTANYTPAGSLNVVLNDTTKYVAGSASGGGSVTPGTAASCTMPTFEVASGSTKLVISNGSFTANVPTAVTLPTFSSQKIATGVKTQTFTGTGVDLEFDGTAGNISVTGTTTGSVSLTKETVTVSPASSGTATYTPAGTVSQPTFSGAGARLVTGNIAVPTSATFTGEEATISVSGTPSGTISKPTFSGTPATINVQ